MKRNIHLTKKECQILLDIINEYLDVNSQGELTLDTENRITKIGDKIYKISER